MAAGEPVVKLISREILVPAKPTERQSYFLSCFDIFWKVFHYNRRVMFYGSATSSEEEARALIEKLKSSLALCLLHYYPWCGRLSAAGGRLFIDCNDAGVEFVEASLALPISLLSHQGFQLKPFFPHLCPKVDHSGDCLYSSPLLSIQATLCSDGGLALGFSHSHVVADGQALWNFMVSWGECARGLPLSFPPVLDRKRLAVPNLSPEKATWEPFVKMKDEHIIDGDDQDVASVGVRSSSADNTEAMEARVLRGAPHMSCVFNMQSSAVKKLKIEDGGVHTSYEVTCAHVWQRLTVARQRPSCEPTSLVVLADCRSRVNPPLPPTYFGNAIIFGVGVSTSVEICNESLHATASRIHNIVGDTIQDSSIERFMHTMESNDHNFLSVVQKFPNGRSITVAGWPWFPIYEVDFGWGKPIAVRSPEVEGDGEIVFSGSNPKFAPRDVEICMGLPSDVLRYLLEDPSFLGKFPSNPFEDE